MNGRSVMHGLWRAGLASLLLLLPPQRAFAQRPSTPPAARPAARPADRAPTTVAVSRGGSIELTGALGLSSVDPKLNYFLESESVSSGNPSRFMPGGETRATFNASRNLGIGIGVAFGTGNGATLLSSFTALTFSADLDRAFSPFFEVGVGMTRFSGDRYRLMSQYEAFAGVGARAMIGGSVALRVEGRMAYDKYSEFSNAAFNGGAFVGLSYFMGGGPPKDTDLDGVPDRKDACASTLRGATVDLRGCPSDTDRDGVLNGLDACPNTPPNTPVDARGCTRDTDNDGVADNLDRCANTPYSARPVDAYGCLVDTDNDSVADYLDRCANTAAGVPVDANGCPRDTDNDGVSDNLDRCPNTPANARPVDANGCTVDSDHDGVPDYLDRCVNTAAGTQVDANGCPVRRDSDGDGVIDANDRCADTPPNTLVDTTGCPLQRAVVDSDQDGVADSVDECPGTPAGTSVDARGCPRAFAIPEFTVTDEMRQANIAAWPADPSVFIVRLRVPAPGGALRLQMASAGALELRSQAGVELSGSRDRTPEGSLVYRFRLEGGTYNVTLRGGSGSATTLLVNLER